MKEPIYYRGHGSVMLFGEYVSSHFGYGIAAPIDQFITATIVPREDREIIITSALGLCKGSLDSLPSSEKLTHVCAALSVCQPFFTHGFELTLESTIDVFAGFGSSAASIVATIGACAQLFHQPFDSKHLIALSIKAVKQLSPFFTGIDCVASVTRKTIAYHPQTEEIIPFQCAFDLTALYSGVQTNHIQKITEVEQMRKDQPLEIMKIFKEIERITNLAMRALENKDLHRLGELMSAHHACQVQLQTSSPILDRLIEMLLAEPQILGAKISGEGGGDCVIGLGSATIDIPFDIPGARIFHLKTL